MRKPAFLHRSGVPERLEKRTRCCPRCCPENCAVSTSRPGEASAAPRATVERFRIPAWWDPGGPSRERSPGRGRSATDTLGLAPVTRHEARHACITIWAQAIANPKRVQPVRRSRNRVSQKLPVDARFCRWLSARGVHPGCRAGCHGRAALALAAASASQRGAEPPRGRAGRGVPLLLHKRALTFPSLPRCASAKRSRHRLDARDPLRSLSGRAGR
jgi:hypothetical protein